MYAYTTNRKEGFHARALLTIPDGKSAKIFLNVQKN